MLLFVVNQPPWNSVFPECIIYPVPIGLLNLIVTTRPWLFIGVVLP